MIKSVAHRLKKLRNLGFKLVKGNEIFFSVITANKYALILSNITGADFKAERNALHFIFRKLPAGGIFAVVKLYTAEFSKTVFNCVRSFKNALFMLGGGDDYDLNGCDIRRKNKTVVVAVGHYYGADKAGGNSPGGFKRRMQLVITAGKLNAECFCKSVAEIVRGSGLKRFAVVHHCFDSVGRFRSGKFFFFGLLTFYHGNGKILFTDVGINIEHTLGFFNGLFCGFVHGVTFLPKEFHSAQEGTRGFFPTADIAPLVIKFRQVAVGLDYFCIMVAEKRFGSGAHAHSFLKLLAAADSYPGNLRRKAFNMVFFLLKKAFRNEHGHIYILVAGFFKTGVKDFLDIFPNGIAVRAKHHAAANAGIINKFGFFYHVGVPLGKVIFH